jgi:hypothetical protein
MKGFNPPFAADLFFCFSGFWKNSLNPKIGSTSSKQTRNGLFICVNMTYLLIVGRAMFYLIFIIQRCFVLIVPLGARILQMDM